MITIRELKKLIKKADYLDNVQKTEFLELLPKMTIQQATKLANMIFWAETQKNNLEFEKKVLTTGVAGIFTKMNKNAIKKTRKVVLEKMQNDQTIQDDIESAELLKKLKDV